MLQVKIRACVPYAVTIQYNMMVTCDHFHPHLDDRFPAKPTSISLFHSAFFFGKRDIIGRFPFLSPNQQC